MRKLVIAAALLVLAASAAAYTVQRQPPAGSCHARGNRTRALPDSGCTPGVRDRRVTERNIGSTICHAGYSKSVRPPESVTEPEKLASMAAYGDHDSPRHYEYDHLISLELGGAPNDQHNLWPEPGASPNPKDRVENRLHTEVCHGVISLGSAQHQIATDWVAAYRRLFGTTP